MRLAGNLPPSTTGRTASITARTLPSGNRSAPAPWALRRFSAIGFPAQHDGRKRRQVERQGLQAAMGADGRRFHAAQIAPPRSAIFACIAVEDLAPYASLGNA